MGADSFTGVINVITKTAEEMQGGKSITTAGTSGVEQIIHLGGKTGETSYARGYVQGSYKNGNLLSGNSDNKGAEDWKQTRGGFRADWTNAFTDALSFQSDIFYSSIMENSPGIGPVMSSHRRNDAGGYAQFVFDRATGLDANIKFRSSYSRTTEAFGDIDGSINTLEAEIEYAMEQSGAHRLSWGVGSRYFWDDLTGGDSVSITSDERYTLTANGYVQDRITLEKNWYLFLGGKVDYFGQTPFELQPSIRLLHTREKDEIWMSVSRAVRTDSRLLRGGSYTIEHGGTTYTVSVPDDLKTEKLIAYEAGYRRELNEEAHLDLSFYVNDYDDLMMLVLDSATNTGSFDNSLKGTTYGMEALVDWRVMPKVTLQPSLSLIYQDIYGSVPSTMFESMPNDGMGGEAKLQVMTQPTDTVGFDVFVAYLDGPKLKGINGYFNLEAHVSWKATDSLMLELIGKNLDGSRERFSPLKVGPSLDLRATWDF